MSLKLARSSMALRSSTLLGYYHSNVKQKLIMACKRGLQRSAIDLAIRPHGVVNAVLPMCDQVYVSTCRDVYANLALEDWVYQNGNATDDGRFNLMFLWRNDPCIVIGRHQNVWVESSVQDALLNHVAIARRRSGGGTVYHDAGNLNITFFTSRKNYDRKQNLKMIADALREQCSLSLNVSPRDDILLNETYKISGTAAKLGSKVAYHHCTLLLHAELNNVKKYLHGMPGVSSKATASVRMQVANVTDHAPNLTYDETIRILTEAYHSRHSSTETRFTYINPTDEKSFPGIHEMRSELKKWDWIFGHTPKFSVDRTFSCHVRGDDALVRMSVEIERGRIAAISITLDDECKSAKFDTVSCYVEKLAMALKGCMFWPDELTVCLHSVDALIDNDELRDWAQCLNDCIVNLVTGR